MGKQNAQSKKLNKMLMMLSLAYEKQNHPKLDFIHLKINKKQGKLERKLCQEVAHAYLANGIYHNRGSLYEAVLEADLGVCKDPVGWCHSFSKRANGNRSVASDGTEW